MPVAIPEHTVDVWAGILIDRAFPTARIWAPTQLSSPDFDLASETREGKLFVLENKAPYATGMVRWEFAIRIDQRQLFNYLAHADLRDRTFYVLPCPPFPASMVAPATAGQPPAPRPVLLPPGSAHRSTAGDWFRVMTAIDLWRSVWPGVPLPTPGRWWPPNTPTYPVVGPRSRNIDPCERTVRMQSGSSLLAPDQSFNELLADIKACARFDDLHWPGGQLSFVDELGRGERFGLWSPTTLAVLVERDERGRIFPNWPSSSRGRIA